MATVDNPPNPSSPTTSLAAAQPEYRVQRKLGEGAFATVFHLVHTKNPTAQLAMKRAKIQSSDVKRQIEYEYHIHHQLSQTPHINVIKMLGILLDRDNCNLYMEYADDGDLIDKITPGIGMDTATAKMYYQQLMSGLEFIHNNNVVHRDIKPDNLLITKSNVLKISDFGLATTWCRQGEEIMLTQSCGTKSYAAPELFMRRPYRGPPVDIWSSGIVLVDMLTGRLPWDGATDDSCKYLQWVSGDLKNDIWNKMEDGAVQFLKKVLKEDVESRATIQQIQADSWFNEAPKIIKELAGVSLKRARTQRGNENDSVQRLGSSDTTDAKRPCLDATQLRALTSSPQLPSSFSGEKTGVSKMDYSTNSTQSVSNEKNTDMAYSHRLDKETKRRNITNLKIYELHQLLGENYQTKMSADKILKAALQLVIRLRKESELPPNIKGFYEGLAEMENRTRSFIKSLRMNNATFEEFVRKMKECFADYRRTQFGESATVSSVASSSLSGAVLVVSSEFPSREPSPPAHLEEQDDMVDAKKKVKRDREQGRRDRQTEGFKALETFIIENNLSGSTKLQRLQVLQIITDYVKKEAIRNQTYNPQETLAYAEGIRLGTIAGKQISEQYFMNDRHLVVQLGKLQHYLSFDPNSFPLMRLPVGPIHPAVQDQSNILPPMNFNLFGFRNIMFPSMPLCPILLTPPPSSSASINSEPQSSSEDSSSSNSSPISDRKGDMAKVQKPIFRPWE